MVKKSRVVILLMSILLVLPFIAVNALGDEPTKAPPGKQVFQSKCLQCHKASKFQNLHYERRVWEQIVARMERNTCVLSDGEFNAVCNYLAKEHGE